MMDLHSTEPLRYTFRAKSLCRRTWIPLLAVEAGKPDPERREYEKIWRIMPQMETTKYREFLEEGTRTAKLATTHEDGRPHVAPIWFVLDGGELVFVTHRDSVKGKYIRREGSVALCVDASDPPYTFVLIEGETETSEEPEEVLRWSTLNARRYVGEEREREYGELNAGEGMMLVRVHPTKVVSEDNIIGE